LEFSCQKVYWEDINNDSVKALLPTRGDILCLAGVGRVLVGCAFLTLASCKKNEPVDEAKAAGLTTADFPQIAADIFKPMDGGIDLSPEEIMGRNTWNLWSGGNQHFWNRASQDSYGLMDLLKMLDDRKYPRGERFKVLGVVNEPGFRAELSREGLNALGLEHINPVHVQQMDSVEHIGEMQEVGQTLAEQKVKAEHFAGFPAAR
jgi:hypothetical protein